MTEGSEFPPKLPADAPAGRTHAPFAFPREQEHLERANRAYRREDISLEEMRSEFAHLVGEYRTLLNQTLKLTRISDSAQKRLLRSQEARLRAEKKYRSIYEQLYEGLFQMDARGEFTEANPAMARLLGYTDAAAMLVALRGRAGTIYEQEQRLAELMQQARDSGTITDAVSLVQRFDGEQIWVSQNIRLIPSEDGEPYFEGSMVDVTTKILADDALQRAKTAAEEANRSKDQFIANMSHELRTPLNGIMGYAQLLFAEDGLSEDQKSGLRIIQRSAEHLLGLINELLDLAKIQANKIELYSVNFEMELFLDTVVGQFADRAAMKGLRLMTHFDPQLPKCVKGDEQKLRQVVFNLLANALKFTDRGDVQFGVRVLPDDRIVFEVIDSGIGISEEDQAKLFIPFEQVGDKSRYSQGTGLGLAISYNLVELMGGHLQVESAPGEGSRFFFDVWLPTVEDADTQATQRGIPQSYKGGPKRVLIVDDDETNRNILDALLRRTGFKTQIVGNAELAIAAATEQPYDLFCLDISLPGMDGFELVGNLRDFHGDRSGYIAVTANASSETAERVRSEGFDAVLLKPFHIEDLFRTIAGVTGIEWIYPTMQPTGSQNLEGELIFPDREKLEALAALAKKGQVRRLKEESEVLLEQFPQYSNFSKRMLSMLSAYQTKALREFLEQGLTEGDRTS